MQAKGKFFSLYVACVGFLVTGSLAFAQVTTGTIQGTIKDEQGAIIPGVEVTVINLDTGVARTVVTDDAGRYLASNLGLGSYEVRAVLAGFQTAVRRGITLTIGQVAVVDLILAVGEVTEEVVVMGEAPLVETTQSSISQVVDERMIRDLPLNVRSYSELATLQVGVVRQKMQQGAVVGYGVHLSFAGARMDTTTYLLDGSEINNVYSKAPNSGSGGIIGVDAVREFQVLTNAYSAQFGSRSGGQLNAVTRSGTNVFHGSVYEFHRNDAFDARNFFDGKIPEFKRNQFGFALGGPIMKDKTFFFGNYEGFRERLGLTLTRTTIDERAREGIVPGRPPIVVNPVVKSYLANLDLFPLPNGRNFGDGKGEFIFSQTEPTDEDAFLIRVDHNFSERDSFFVRHAFNDGERLFGGDVFRQLYQVRNNFTTIEEKHIFSPQVLNILRFSFNRGVNWLRDPNLVQIPRELWFNNQVFPGDQPFGNISISGGGGTGSSAFNPKNLFLNLIELANDISYNRGGHSLKFGGVAKRMLLNIQSAQNLRGSYAFSSLENFLRGQTIDFRSQTPDSNGIRGARQSMFGFYLQDDYRLRSNLTLNLGLRYEFITVPTEVNGKLSNLRDLLDPQVTIGDPFFKNPSLKNFAPRIGFAWDPFADGKTSIRGGYGIFYDEILYNIYNVLFYRSPPFMKVAQIRNARFPDAFREIEGGNAPFELNPQNIEWDLAQPYMQQWNFSVQRQMLLNTAFSLGYVGSRGLHLGRLVDNIAFSIVAPNGRQFVPVENRNKRRNPNFAEIRQRSFDVSSFYHGLVASLNKRFSAGFQAQVSYTFSRSIDDMSIAIGGGETTTEGQWGTLPEYAAFDRGLSLFDTRHNLVFNTALELPFGTGKPFGSNLTGVAGKLVSGWTINGIVNLQSGSPITPGLGFNRVGDARSGGVGHRPDLVPGRSNNPVLGGPDRYFDPSAFALPAEGFYGTLGRNTIIMPGVATWDLSLVKNMRLSSVSDGFNIQFRAEFFNILNRANFAVPQRIVFTSATGIPSGNVGRITETSTSSRQVQLGLKILW
ncbi:MAG: TonB-dependent receptor [Acidobacteria bacterium]|nr:TonB-dependent receptor [Acidobacteriota bacterium]